MRKSRSAVAAGAFATLACTTGSAWGDAPATDETTPAAPPVRPLVQCRSGHDRQNLLGLLLDAGQGPVSYGARYLNQSRNSSGCGGLGFTSWFGFGAEIRGDGVSAMEAQAVGRLGGSGDVLPLGLELAAGAGTTFGRTIALGTATALVDFDYFGVGASYRFPIGFDRPQWLGGLELALRIHFPLSTYDAQERRWSAPRPW
jgi:hypothetical protein